MITIHEKNSIRFDSLGLGALLPSLCCVTEELNGLYELELEHPYDERGKWEKIEKERIIFASTPSGKQPFRIYYVNPSLDGIKVNARHIFYDLLDNVCLSVNATGTPQAALDAITSALAYTVPFTLSTTITGTGTVTADKANPVTALLDSGDDATSFIKAFGGEILRDGFSVTMKTSIGSDRGVAIRYGKNLVGLEITEDISDVATRILPIGKDGLQGSYVDSPYISNYAHPKIYVMEDSQLATIEQLEYAAQTLLDGGADLPKVNIKVDFQMLSKTVEYANYAILEEVFLGDVVTVTNGKMNFSKKAKVISYAWDCLLERYNEVELGDFVADLTTSVTSGEKSLATALGASTEVKQILNLISGNITITSNTLYICMDNADYTLTTKLFRWGTGGLQFSSTGVNGTWNTIIDANGNLAT
ncbi:MAG: hypothetical protein EOM28_00975 [Clostridia bacterium]|nr:hypothetical protein [Clostridia bacterium]